jgi:uncharacterized protein YqgC (DUF456 family)
MTKKSSGGRRRQGIASWITSIIALFLGLSPVWSILNGLFSGGNLGTAAADLNRTYNPLTGDRAALAAGYGSLVGGIVFKVAASELIKRAQIRSVIPALHA